MANKYDHRLRNAIVESGNPNLFRELGIPASTVRDWFRKGTVDVITIPQFEYSARDLILENEALKQALERANAKSELVTRSVTILGFQIQYRRLPKSEMKKQLIEVIQTAAKVVPLSVCLETIKLSAARFRSWIRRQKACRLEDYPSCPRLTPSKILPAELAKIKEIVLDPALRHFSVASLALYAKRCEEVVASASSWYRVIKEFKLIRPGKRIYPGKPTIGIRASKPCQIWHLDQTLIKLTDGTRCFIQAVIDNFSRYVLAWSVSRFYGGEGTKEVLNRFHPGLRPLYL